MPDKHVIPYLIGGPLDGRFEPGLAGGTVQTIGYTDTRGESTIVTAPRTHTYAKTKLGSLTAFVHVDEERGAFHDEVARQHLLSEWVAGRVIPQVAYRETVRGTTLFGADATLVLQDREGNRIEIPLPVAEAQPGPGVQLDVEPIFKAIDAERMKDRWQT